MKPIRLFIVLLGLLVTFSALSQISRGGTPYFLQPSALRNSTTPLFVEMPPFDLDSALREDAVNEGNMRGSLRFAHKFYTHINIKDAYKTVLPDGTTVKQIGIRSSGAYSINILLRDFELPPGGKLFVYSLNHSHVVGSFDHRNNSADQLLPIQPVAGETIMIEYSEPANAPFTGRFTIAEVNHDYRDILRTDPNPDLTTFFACMPDVICSDATGEAVRSTVLLIINGNTLCSGSLLNNTSDNGKPYVLTAVHCFVGSVSEYPKDMDYYNSRAGTIVAFFNYNRPVCDPAIKMKGSEEMSLAGASARVILEKNDIALLEFSDSPPDYFNAYYAGWKMDLTASGARHFNLHHPNGAVKKYGMTNGTLQLVSLILDSPNNNVQFEVNSFWKVPYWTTGSTYEGSSGSPLFNENQLVIGGLTAGSSYCTGTAPNNREDWFFALGRGWETGEPDNQLKTYLDSGNKGVMQYSGKDPNLQSPVVRLANADYSRSDLLITSMLDSPNQGYVFGKSDLQTVEFAEEFTVEESVDIFGTYLLIPAMPFNYTSGITVSVYTGDESPETEIYSTSFVPRYLNYSSSSGFHPVNKNTNTAPTETFVVFDEPLTVKKKFFISYTINHSTTAQFCVYNTNFNDPLQPNTAWLKDVAKGWVPADAYDYKPLKTSLAIHPLIRSKNDNQTIELPAPENNCFYYDRSERRIKLMDALAQPGHADIYSIGGHLLEKISIQSGQTVITLSEQPRGVFGIVKITTVDYSCMGKIIY